MRYLRDLSNLSNKIIILRADLNTPLENNQITSAARITAVKPTIDFLLKKNSKIILITHLGDDTSTKILLPTLKKIFDCNIDFSVSLDNLKPNPIVLLENIRLSPGEKENSVELSKKLAGLGEIFVFDAFATAHRNHASTAGISRYISNKAAGFLVESEIKNLNQVLQNPSRPVTAVIGGAKISSKLPVIKNLLDKVDNILLGGGVANTVILDKTYQEFLLNKKIYVPVDFVRDQDKALDIGPETIKKYNKILATSKTILTSGPMGMFEDPRYANGTKQILTKIASLTGNYTVAGGGDTVSALEQYNLFDKFSYVSTGGSAFLEYLAGNKLPALVALGE